ncbi:MAG: hypothetical protein V2J10_03965, partial [Wenzhouxiangella sp.]|nr:hypothetical protein [Wenzhouxiangella sp.]
MILPILFPGRTAVEDMGQSLDVRDNAFRFRPSAGFHCAFALSLPVFCLLALVGLQSPVAAADVVASGDSEHYKLALLRTALEEAKLLPEPDGISGPGDGLGYSVSLSGDRALVGGSSLLDTGAAIVFLFSGSDWEQESVLVPSDGESNDGFGQSVSIDGARALVGAAGDDIASNQAQGSAYVFDLVGGNWIESAKLTASDGAQLDGFGVSVSLLGNRALIGSDGSNVDGNAGQGSAYVFEFAGGSWSESAKLTASDGNAFDNFGFSASLASDRALIGAFGDDIGTSDDQGSAYIFDFVSGSWSQSQKISAGDGAPGDEFGFSVSLDGDRALIGALSDDASRGSAYVFDLVSGNWAESQKLIASGGGSFDHFGFSVSLRGDRVLIGAPDADGPVNSTQGAAYVFDFLGGSWTQTQQLTASDGLPLDEFGVSVSLGIGEAFVGAFGVDIDHSGQGAAYFFESIGGSWSEAEKLSAAAGAGGVRLGSSISLDGDRALVAGLYGQVGVGSIFEFDNGVWNEVQQLMPSGGVVFDLSGRSASPVSLDGDRALIGMPFDTIGGTFWQGSAYVFDLISGAWTETQRLTASDGSEYDKFGSSVSLDGDRLLVGAPGELFASNSGQGSAYVFEFDGGSWLETSKLTASDGANGDEFGTAISLAGDLALVGAPRDDVGANSNQGSVHAFEFAQGRWQEIQQLTDVIGSQNDRFGQAVTLDGDRALVGATRSDDWRGAVHAYRLTGARWSMQGTLIDPQSAPDDALGTSVALDGTRALAGAAGAAQLFYFGGMEWQLATAIEAADGRPGDEFGNAVVVERRRVMVGAPGHDDRGGDSGAAYVFRLPPLVGGTVGGLAGTGLVIQHFPGSEAEVSYDTPFSFDPDLSRGTGYEVSVLSQPTDPPQTCTVTNGSGMVGDDDVTDIAIDCVTDSAPIQGPSTIAASNRGAQFAPRVAWDPERERWLAVWDQDVEGVRRIVGRFVNKEGFPVGSSFFISDDTVDQTAPDIAYDPLEEQYLVVWVREFSATDNDLWIREVPWSGPEAGLPPRTLVQPTTSESAPALAYSPDQTEFFLTWQRDDGVDPPAIWGAPLGQPVPPGVITGMSIASDSTFARQKPRIAWNEQSQTYLIVYERSLPSAQSDVYVSLVEPSGSTVEMDRGIAGFSGDEHEVDVAACGENWLVVWTGEQPTYGDVFSRLVDAALDLGAIRAFGVDEVDNRYPAVACNPHNGDFFATWQQYSSTEGRMIRGAFIDPEGGAPEPFRISDSATGDATRPAVSVADAEERAYVIWERDASGIEEQNLEGRWVRMIPSYGVGGTVDGLDGSGLTLQLDVDQGQISLIEPLAIARNGPYAFLAEIDNGQGYEVQIDTQPTQPRQTCEIVNEQGTINGASVSNVDVSCTTNTYPVGGTVSGLEGSGLVLRNNGGDDLP